MSRAKFKAELTAAYVRLFASDPDYANVATRMRPEDLTEKMIGTGPGFSGNVDGKGIRAACKACGIRASYKAINAFIGEVA